MSEESDRRHGTAIGMMGTIIGHNIRSRYNNLVDGIRDTYDRIVAGKETSEQKEKILSDEKERVKSRQEYKHAEEIRGIRDGTKYWFARGTRHNQIRTKEFRLETAEADADHQETMADLENRIGKADTRKARAEANEAVNRKINLLSANRYKEERNREMASVYQEEQRSAKLENQHKDAYIRHQDKMADLDDITFSLEERQKQVDLRNQERENARKDMEAEYAGLERNNRNYLQQAKDWLFKVTCGRKSGREDSPYAREMVDITRKRATILAREDINSNDVEMLRRLKTQENMAGLKKEYEAQRTASLREMARSYS